VNWQGRPGLHRPGAPGTRSWGPVQIGIGVDSAGADDWNEGAVDEIVDDGSATAVGAFDGRETATGDPVVRTAPPVHAAIVRVRAMPKTASPRLAEGAW